MTTLKSVLRAATTELAYPRSVAEFSDHRSAQNAVDRLVRGGIPPHEIAVVGRDVRSVERVVAATGLGAAVRFGAVLGAWCGLAFGLPFLLAADPRGLTLPISTAILGALIGLVFGTVGVGSRGGAPSYATAPVRFLADHYEVQVEHRHAERAREVLAYGPTGAPTMAETG